MKITFVVPNLALSGGIKIVLLYAEGLAKRGHGVTVVSGPTAGPSVIDRARQFFSRSRPSRPDDQRHSARYIQAKHVDSRLISDLPDADILIGTWWETVESIKDAPASKGEKCHLIQGHEIFPFLPLNRTEAVYRLPFHKIAVSQWLVDVVSTTYGVSVVDLVANPIDLSFFPYIERTLQKVPTVGTVFSPMAIKNSSMAFSSVVEARRVITDLQFVGFGTDAAPRHWPAADQANFRRRPSQTEIASTYASADFWLFTSESEGFGLPILEAMASGTPVIATPAGAAPQLVGHETGTLVDHSVAEMTDAIVRLYAAGEKNWRRLSRNCRTEAERHGVDEAVDRMEETLARVSHA